MLVEPDLIDITDDEETTVTVAEYLAMWGCDPCYDRAPRKPGDGYTFYNYGSEGDDLTYLKERLVPAVTRQLQDTTMSDHDREQFEAIKTFAEAKVKALEAGQEAPPVAREEETFTNEMLVKITYGQVRKAMKGEPFKMRLRGQEYGAFASAVNQGIDARLQACFSHDRGDKSDARGNISISEESLPVLIRRLYEADDERANSLAAGIMSTLGFSDTGKWSDPDDE
jgi:hypothetical protein